MNCGNSIANGPTFIPFSESNSAHFRKFTTFNTPLHSRAYPLFEHISRRTWCLRWLHFYQTPVVMCIHRVRRLTHFVQCKTLAESLEMNVKNGPNTSSPFQGLEFPCPQPLVQISLLEHKANQPFQLSVWTHPWSCVNAKTRSLEIRNISKNWPNQKKNYCELIKAFVEIDLYL